MYNYIIHILDITMPTITSIYKQFNTIYLYWSQGIHIDSYTVYCSNGHCNQSVFPSNIYNGTISLHTHTDNFKICVKASNRCSSTMSCAFLVAVISNITIFKNITHPTSK